MVNPSCPKTSADPMLGIHNGACGYACLIIAVTACHTAISMICHRKNGKPCKMWSWIENELIELINSNQFRLSIPIQFQFKIFQFNSNSIHAELNWIDYQFQFNSWIDPSPGPPGWRGIVVTVRAGGRADWRAVGRAAARLVEPISL